MSVRVYHGLHSDRGRPRKRWQQVLPWVLLGLALLALVVAPFTEGAVNGLIDAAAVVLACGAVSMHAVMSRGWTWGLSYVGITLGAAIVIQGLATATAFPFGQFTYSSTFGPSVFGVPIVIPLSWVALAYPCLLAGQRMAHERLAIATVGAVLLTGIDLLWDPVIAIAGHRTWSPDAWTIPGLVPMPWQNLLGWLLVGFVLVLVLDRLPRRVAKDGVPNVWLSGLFVIGVVVHVMATPQPWSVLWGGLAMGIIIAPWWWKLWSQPQW